MKTLVANILAERGPSITWSTTPAASILAPRLDQPEGLRDRARTNLVGGFLVAREVFNQSMSKTGGSIVNMLADMGRHARHGSLRRRTPGMENFTRTAAVEWGHAGVRVNAVAPGWIASSGMDTYEGAFKAVIPTCASTCRSSASAASRKSPPPSSSCPRRRLRQRQHDPHRRRRQPGSRAFPLFKGKPDRAARTTASTAPTCPTY